MRFSTEASAHFSASAACCRANGSEKRQDGAPAQPGAPCFSQAFFGERKDAVFLAGQILGRRKATLFLAGGTGCGFSRGFLREDAGKNRIDVAKLALQIKCLRQRLRVEIFRDARIAGDTLAKIGV